MAGAVAFAVGLFGAVRVHVVRDWRQTAEPFAFAAAHERGVAARTPIAADTCEVVGGLTPTFTLSEASALK